ncbi:ribonuclease Z [Dysgonomonas sp. PH5-45]|uniref:ribonuclease Z n=1 Tax=unclassified Dysgonomonas TaxID=2630389 RepID=UPI00247311C4|nr:MULTISPECIES: ribonuclease Z [unclassified Dysgonomonas]MDH6353794.1 ribonuclease Z [Dysgonomonas sp. PH5-45]MDH6386696.1 ribonuclease Z [Dysgonomonas sp. PH5-37]
MKRFELNILGCGSALPTQQHWPSSQIVNVRDKLFMVDCGEGAQLQFRKTRLGFNRLNRIFISHLHGDHCFGLMGLISTLALLGRTGDLVIHAVSDIEQVMQPQLDYFCREMPYKVVFEAFDASKNEVIYEDRSIKVSTIPLNHRVPCAGFLFREQQSEAHLIKEMVDFYKIPIKELVKIKQGADFVTEDGVLVPNNRLTRPAEIPRSYAYCSDTAYNEKIVPIIEGVDLLYHESTFAQQDASHTIKTGHSTAAQAATIAKMANVGKLILGHFSSRYSNNNILLDEAKLIFPNTILANEGMCVNI